jgi:hypothetical protein
VQISWTAVPGAIGHRIYGRINGTFGLLADIPVVAGQTSYTWTDNGVAVPGVAPPAISTSGVHYVTAASINVQAKFTKRL